MTSWLHNVEDCIRRGEPCVLVTVASTRGSTPREVGAKMLVTEQSSNGSIGGGQLEYQCIEYARQQIPESRVSQPKLRSRTFPLGADCGQCCGGVAEILFEPITNAPGWTAQLAKHVHNGQAAVMATLTQTNAPLTKLLITLDGCTGDVSSEELSAKITGIARRLLTRNGPAEKRTVGISGNVKVPVLLEPVRPCDFNVTVFGAGHVGSAVVRVLSELPCHVIWVDSRADLLRVAVPDNVEKRVSPQPDDQVAKTPPGGYFLVMTHSHPLDQAICIRILERSDFAYCGLIGSQSKKRRFDKRFRALGFPEEAYRAITCPIGAAGISGKKPGEIAVAVAAELLQVREQAVLRSVPAEPADGHSLFSSGALGGR